MSVVEKCADLVHTEARWCHEMAMRGRPQDAVERLLELERTLRQVATPADERLDGLRERQAPGVAAALSLALRKAARDHLGLTEGDYWPSELAAAQATALLDAGWCVTEPATPEAAR